MSLPPNPLAKYRSYSYHHVLIIADSVETANSATNNVNLAGLGGITSSDSVNAVTASNGGRFVVVSNGLRDVRYVIEKLDFETLNTSSGTKGSEQNTQMTTGGSLTIKEPKGVKFMQDLATVYGVIGKDKASMVWSIKTIFVGHSDNPGVGIPTDAITYVKPFTFTVTDFIVDFTEAGGVYTMELVGLANGTAKLPALNNIAETIKMDVGAEKIELPDVLSKFFSLVQQKYDTHIDEQSKIIEEEGNEVIKVKYEFVLDEHYKKFSGSYLVKDLQQQATTIGTDDAGPILDFTKHVTIENALKTILSSCSAIKKDALGETDDGNRYIFKIRSVVKSTPTEHKVVYVIRRYRLLMDKSGIDIEKGRDVQQSILDSNTLVLDYIFSGKNIDIIDFSMRLEMGLSFFNTLISGNNIVTQKQGQDSSTTITDQKAAGQSTDTSHISSRQGQPKKQVAYAPALPKSQNQRNSKNPKDTTEFQTLLDRHAATEMIGSKIKIWGNPNILNSVNRLPSEYIDKNSNVVANKTFSNWEETPCLMKINVFMPDESNDHTVTKISPFWYTGLYQIFSIASTFENGEFTQELELNSLPGGSTTSIERDKTKESAAKPPKKEVQVIQSEDDTIEEVQTEDIVTETKELVKDRLELDKQNNH
jgi:hypothetical protein